MDASNATAYAERVKGLDKKQNDLLAKSSSLISDDKPGEFISTYRKDDMGVLPCQYL